MSKFIRFGVLTSVLAVAAVVSTAQTRDQGAEPVAAGASVQWSVAFERGGATLTVSRPDGIVIREEFAAGETPSFNGSAKGGSLPDGTYSWQIVFAPRSMKTRDAATPEGVVLADEAQGRVVSGTFSVVNGAIRLPRELPERAPKAAAEVVATPEDQVIPDDLIVQGSTCVGLDCVNNESFGFDTIRLKENNTRIKFEDTSTGSFPTTDWQLTANDSASGGASKFSIEDITGARVPFTVTGGAATNSIFVDSTGRVGFRTSTPVLDLHVNPSHTPPMPLERNNPGGFPAQSLGHRRERGELLRARRYGRLAPSVPHPSRSADELDRHQRRRQGGHRDGIASPQARRELCRRV